MAWDQTSGTHGDTADVTTRGGSTAFSTASDTAAITVSDVNDAPALHAPTEVSVAEDTPLAFTGDNALSLTDVDAGAGTMQIGFDVQHGALALDTPFGGLTFHNTHISLNEPLAAINTILQSAVFTPDEGFTGDASVTLTGGEGSRLDNRIQHYVDRNISDMIQRLDRYSSLRAMDLRRSGDIGTYRANLRRIATRFWKCYVSRKGYREGQYGFLVALCAAIYPILSYLKARHEKE